jgi:hypothetical protein
MPLHPLRSLPPSGVLFSGELGQELDEDTEALFNVFWPECFESQATGKVVMADEDRARLERLFKRFGAPLKVEDNSLTVVGHAYDVFGLNLSSHVLARLRSPEDFKTLCTYWEWPHDWVAYVEAVALGDPAQARAYALALQPLSPDCAFPSGVTRFDTHAAGTKKES